MVVGFVERWYIFLYLVPESWDAMPKRRMSSDERREQILEKATEVFAEFGLDGARTRQIAKACGINEALLYKHFANKEQLFMEVLRRMHVQYEEEWRTATHDASNALEDLGEIHRNQVEVLYGNPWVCSCIFHGVAAATRNERLREYVSPWLAMAREYAEVILKRGIEDGSIRADIDSDAVSYWLVAFACLMHLVVVLGLEEFMPPEKAIRVFSDYLSGIASERLKSGDTGDDEGHERDGDDW